MDAVKLFLCVMLLSICSFTSRGEDARNKRNTVDHLQREKRSFSDLISGTADTDYLHRVKRQRECGANLTGLSGIIEIPPHKAESCVFHILAPVDYKVMVNFSQSDGWSSSNGAVEVEIYNETDNKDNYLGRLQTRFYMYTPKKVYTSTVRSMLIKVNRSSSGSSSIFAAYTAIKAAPIVKVQNRTLDIKEGSNLTLVCNVDSKEIDLLGVTWELINGGCITYPINTSSSNYEDIGTNDTYSLVIKNVSISDQGIYKCHAENKVGSGVSSSINVTVIEYSRPNVKTARNVEVYYGMPTTLFCTSTSDIETPIETMSWLKNSSGIFITISKDFKKTITGRQANISIFIKSANKSHEGDYLCSASNRKGKQIASTRLSVVELDECENETLNTCPQVCENTMGSFICKCWQGYDGDGQNCDINFKQIGTELKSTVIPFRFNGIGIWNDSLEDKDSFYYKSFTSNFTTVVNKLLGHLCGYRETRIISISKGSVMVYSAVIADQSANTSVFYETILSSTNTSSWNRYLPGTVIVNRPVDGLGFISKVTIKNESISEHEGADINITCVSEAFSVSGSIKFYWTFDGLPIRPSRVSRLQTYYRREKQIRYVSTLRIVGFKQSDEGNYTCNAKLDDNRKNANVTVMIYRYTLESSSTAVLNGTNVSATCILFPASELANNTLEFCSDGKRIAAGDPKIKFDNNKVILQMASLSRYTNISCGWKKDEGCSRHKKITIAVFNPGYISCPNQTDDRNISWPKTFPGLTAVQNCSAGYIGKISRECSKDGYNGTWMEPSYISCTREKIAILEKKLNRIKDGVEVDKLVNVIREFKNESREITQSNVSASDVRSGVQVLATVSDIVINREEKITKEETEEFFKATDVILSGNSEDSWQDLADETGDNTAALVMDIVANVSDTVLKTLPVDKDISVVGDNIMLRIENTNISSIAFPKNKSAEIKSTVFFSEETIKNSLNVTDSVKYSAAYYKTLGNFFSRGLTKEEIGSAILAFSVPSNDILRKLDPPVRMTFETKETNLTGRICSYWNTKLANGGAWAEDGCHASFQNESFTECKCNHLTNFAVLISVKEISKKHHEIMSMVSLLGFIISIVCLILTIFIYIHQWRLLKSDKAVILLIMCIILIVAYFTYIFGVERTENKYVCTGVAVALHYLFLVILCLMASEGIIHAVLVVAVFPQRQSINRFLIPLSFGIPLVIVVISGSITQLDGYGTKSFCWLSTDSGLIYSFFGPCAVVVLVNFIITGLLLKKLFSTRATMNKTKKEKIKTGIRSLLILAPVFGLTWLFGLFSFHEDTLIFVYLFVICNSLQGALIFLMHTFMNQTVKKEISRTISRIRKQKDVVTTTSSEGSSTWNVFKKLRTKISSDTKMTTDGVALESSVCNPSYAAMTKSEESSVIMDTNKMTGREEIAKTAKSGRVTSSSSWNWNIFKKIKKTVPRNGKAKSDDEDGTVYNPTYGVMEADDNKVITKLKKNEKQH